MKRFAGLLIIGNAAATVNPVCNSVMFGHNIPANPGRDGTLRKRVYYIERFQSKMELEEFMKTEAYRNELSALLDTDAANTLLVSSNTHSSMGSAYGLLNERRGLRQVYVMSALLKLTPHAQTRGVMTSPSAIKHKDVADITQASVAGFFDFQNNHGNINGILYQDNLRFDNFCKWP